MSKDIVISGIAGRYPGCESVDELRDALFAKKDLVTEDESRWPLGFNGVPKRSGKLSQINRFDAQYFGINGVQTNHMDPQLRILFELAIEAILDSGTDPTSLSGTRTGVFIGGHLSGTEFAIMNNGTDFSGSILTGCERTMLANRISYFLNLNGPSYAISTACSSSATALDQAVTNIRQGKCEAAIVGGSALHLNYGVSLAYKRLNMISDDGKCKFLDQTADGYVRSEVCSVIFLQKTSHAKRIYATILNINANTNGFRAEGITHPSQEIQTLLIKRTLEEVNLDPSEVNYIEAHGTGTQAGDQCEMGAIASVYGKHRKTPLMVGSVKTNVGHAEEASALASVAKVVIAFENRRIPPIIHLKTPNPNIPSLTSGLIRPVIESIDFDDTIVGVSSSGFGGANVHFLLKPHTKDPDVDCYDIARPLPRLIPLFGRTETAVQRMADFVVNNPRKISKEFLNLLGEVSNTANMNNRNYLLAKMNGDKLDYTLGQTYDCAEVRPLWFTFSGLGSQWRGMAPELMKIESTRSSLLESNQIIRGFNNDKHGQIDLLSESYDCKEIVSSSLGIVAVQIALIDMFNELNITAEGFLGHSLGEIASAYYDHCLDRRQALELTYWKCKILRDNHTKRGLMAAVGLSWDECQKICPSGVVVACHNSQNSVTISGEYEATNEFIKQLRSESIFVKEVNSNDLAMHSPLIAPCCNDMMEEFAKVIDFPKKRSKRWISTSVLRSVWDSELGQFCSAQYMVNNILSPVWFYDAIQNIPKNAIVVEVSPDCSLQSIIKKNLGTEIQCIALMRRNNNPGNIEMILSAIGRLYQLGLKPSISRLYPSVSYPVSRGTQSLSSLIQWDHSDEWFVPLYPEYFNPNKSSEYKVTIDLDKNEDHFYIDHQIDSKIVFPGAGYMVLIWQMIAKQMSKPIDQVPIIMESIAIHRATLLRSGDQIHFTMHRNDDGEFYLKQNDEIVFSGRIQILHVQDHSESVQHLSRKEMSECKDNLELNSNECYRELNLRGYEYGPAFRSIQSFNLDNYHCRIAFNKNWVTFIDALLQMIMLTQNHRRLALPVSINYFECDPSQITKLMTSPDCCEVVANYDKSISTLVTSGIVMKGVDTNLLKRNTKSQTKVIEKYRFSPCNQNIFDRDLIESVNEMCATRLKAIKNILFSIYTDRVKVNDYSTGSSPAIAFDSSTKLPSILNAISQIISDNTLYKQAINIFEIEPSTKFETKSWFRNTMEKCLSQKGVMVNIVDNSTQMYQADLIIYECIELLSSRQENQLDSVNILRNCQDQLKENSFLLVIQRKTVTPVERLLLKLQEKSLNKLNVNLEDIATEFRFACISKVQLTGLLSISLFRKIETKLIRDQTFISVKTLSYEWIDILKHQLREHESRPLGHNVWLIADDCPYNGIIGLVNCLRKEPGGHRIRCLFFTSEQRNAAFNPNDYSDIITKDLVINIINNGIHGVYTHIDCENSLREELTNCEHSFINVEQIGDLSSLKWYESEHKYWPIGRQLGQRIVDIYYSALNFRDIMLATGKLKADALPGNIAFSDCQLGLEYSGRDETGKRVMGIIAAKSLATTLIINDEDFTWTIPDQWTMEEASTVPMAYCTAYYALVVRGDLKPGNSVLIHAGAGAVGQAAIRIVLHMGGTVFTTVSSKMKQNYLRGLFPALTESSFANSRETTFESHIMKVTNGKGVDIVLNSLAKSKLQAGIRCVAKHGRFLEIGKVDMSLNNNLGMSAFLKNIQFHGILVDALFEKAQCPNSIDDKRRIRDLISDGIRSGAVVPLQRTLFSKEETEDAFRYMASGKHIGKVVIKLRDEETYQTISKKILVGSKPRIVFSPIKSYIIIGGLGGFGLELIHWMVERGAKILILNSRSGVQTNYQRSCIDRIQQLGVSVTVNTNDSTSYTNCLQLMHQANSIAPIGGIFNLAVILHDGILENQTSKSFELVCKTKIASTLNLDRISRELSNCLDYFVVFSSIVSGRGDPGLTNYGFANSSIERTCEQRRKDGMHGLAIQWGPVADVGVVGVDNKPGKDIIISGATPQKVNSCIELLDQFLPSPESVLCSHVKIVSEEDRVVNKELDLMSKVCKVLGIRDYSRVSPTTTLAEMGMDSLMVTEVKLIFDSIGKNYSTNELRNITINEIKSMN